MISASIWLPGSLLSLELIYYFVMWMVTFDLELFLSGSYGEVFGFSASAPFSVLQLTVTSVEALDSIQECEHILGS